MDALRNAIATGDEASFIDHYARAIEQGDLDAARLGLSTLRGLPRPASVGLIGRLRERWPGLVPHDHPSYVDGDSPGGELAPSSRLQALLRRTLDGDREGAHADVDRRASKWDAMFGDAGLVRALIDNLPARDALPRQLVVDRGEELIASAPGERGTFVVFCGLSDHPTFDVPVLDAWVARAGYRGVYVRDHGRTLFAAGIDSVSGGRAGLRDRLRELVGQSPGDVAFAGTSVGGFGAVDWGCELGVGRIVGFSTPTTTRPDGLRAIGENRCQMLQARVAGSDVDVSDRLTASGFDGRLHLYFGDGMTVDRCHAEAVALPQAVLHPVAGYAGHHVLFPLAWSGRLGAVIAGED